MSDNKNNDIKFEDLVDNYSYQQNNDQNQNNNNSDSAPVWSNQTEAPKNNGYNIASLVLGILSIVCCCVYGIVSIVLGILAIVFFVISKKKGTSNGMALAGLICAIFGIILGIIYLSLTLLMLDEILAMSNEALSSMEML